MNIVLNVSLFYNKHKKAKLKKKINYCPSKEDIKVI